MRVRRGLRCLSAFVVWFDGTSAWRLSPPRRELSRTRITTTKVTATRKRPRRDPDAVPPPVKRDVSPPRRPSPTARPPPPLRMTTALGIVPPDPLWDTIQRARHFARDSSYTKWPPCIRLFHPFSQTLALQVARVIEKYGVEPFDITLNAWSVVPHLEAMEADWLAMQKLPAQVSLEDDRRSKERAEVDDLIAREVEVGKEKLQQRQQRKANQSSNSNSNHTNSDATNIDTNTAIKHAPHIGRDSDTLRKDSTEESSNVTDDDDGHPHQNLDRRDKSAPAASSPRAMLDRQKRMYEEFNGPCIVCLEPDQESKERLIELRHLLCQELGMDPAFSPSSANADLDTRLPKAAKESEFRPILPIASFTSVNAAIDMARKLRGLWDPLTFTVSDFQVISCEAGGKLDEFGDNAMRPPTRPRPDPYAENREYQLRKTSFLSHVQDQERNLTPDGQFGCDALIMFLGEEPEEDERARQKRKPDVQVMNSDGCESEDEMIMDDNKGSRGLELWLSEDDDFDEGTAVAVGRTLFFTGETREFVGMPATSVVDAKDRILGDGVSGAARRRSTVHRSGSLWEDGEWGRKEVDSLPWSKMERGAMTRAQEEYAKDDDNDDALSDDDG